MNKPKIVVCAALALASIGVTSGVQAQQPPARGGRRRHNCRKRLT